MKDLDTLKMDELHGILIAYEMRKGFPSSKDAALKASKSKKGKNGIPVVMTPMLNSNWRNLYKD